ncbi:MAG: DUF2867 domain-containing protein, partial [Anaerolineae bacterium]|nr:DUF2867 domain-containing protein [Anaerolineae bacterium]
IIVGSGSASFEMIRYLTERIPVMISPRWVFSRIQPIAIQDVMDYLAAALETPESAGRIIEIGGESLLTYAEMMLGYAKFRGLHRVIIPVPVLTPGLSSYWVHWVTPVSARIAHPLIEGLRNEVIVRDDSARRLFPQIEPISYEAAVRLALADLQAGQVETAWTDALTKSQPGLPAVKVAEREGIIVKRWEQIVDAPAQAAFDVFTRLGGQRGWLYVNWIWSLRGIADRLVDGVGLCRGRRHPELLRTGDVVDCWRVEALESARLLRLRSELKAPGQLWLQFEARPQEEGKLMLAQTLFYAPKGLWGFLYWYLFYPAHSMIFSGLMRK